METLIRRFLNLIKKLQSTSGRIEKENILKEYQDDEEIKEIFKFIYDPYTVTGISTKKIEKYNNIVWNKEMLLDYELMLPDNMLYVDFLGFLNYFKVHTTGSGDDVKYLTWYCKRNCTIDEEIDLVYGIISKNIKTGIQPTTLNKIYGNNFIRKFDVMLAQKYFDNPEKLLPEGTEFILSTKLDGVRCVCIYDEDMPRFYSRQGQLIEGLDDLMFEFRQMPNGHVFDGELLLKNDEELDSKDLYRATMKVVGADGVKKNIIFNCFDILTIDGFENGYCSTPAKERKQILKNLLSKYQYQFIKNVDNLYQGTDQSQIYYWLDKITNEGGEGVMINIADAPYECKRTKNLLKVKKFQSADVKVIDLEEGTGQNKNSLGAVKVEFIGPDNKIYTCKVGSGFKQDERKYFWEHKDKILNKIIEIGYFEITNNQLNDNYSLRFPTFKWLRDDKTEISMY